MASATPLPQRARARARALSAPLLRVLLLLLLLPAARPDADDDSDSAPFLIVVEHESGWRCAASLVSLRTGVTSARCARGGAAAGALAENARDVWALAAARVSGEPRAPAAAGARRLARLALAGDGRDPADPALDLAVFELEAPFGEAAGTRPILMATERDACGTADACYAVRALPAPEGRLRLRVVDLAPAPDARCAANLPHWRASRARLLCLSGDRLCERDLGGGVVCGGKLCGVLSEVATGVSEATGAGGGERCGDTFAAQSIDHWRHFLHCAHTLRLCGSGMCEHLCTERRLLEGGELTDAERPAALEGDGAADTERPAALEGDGAADTVQPATPEGVRAVDTELSAQPTQLQHTTPVLDVFLTSSSTPCTTTTAGVELPPSALSQRRTRTRTRPPAPLRNLALAASLSPRPLVSRTQRTRSRVPTPAEPFALEDEHVPSLRPVLEFEPNRADFRASSSRTPRVRLKAGEYGDNAADYGGEEPAPAARAPPPRAPPPRTRAPPARTPRAPPAPALQLPPPTPAPAAACALVFGSAVRYFCVSILLYLDL